MTTTTVGYLTEAKVRALMDAGTVRTWADGFGVWHASMALAGTVRLVSSRRLAAQAIRLELQDRAPRDTHIPPPRMTVVSWSEGWIEYKEADLERGKK